MLVSGRCGCARGRGTILGASRVIDDVAVTKNTDLNGSWDASFRETRGAFRGRNRGGALSSCAVHAEYINTDMTPMDDSRVIQNPPVDFPL